MKTDEIVTVKFELSRDEAWALAQFCKRAHFGTCERLSDPANKDEPQLMMDGICAVQRGLREAGYAPR